ncbi:hypothetical protein [uncultured Legionella sp.]|uniref:hypothetical protein n=1 Tax=uncultured Legionella sp. TaxID=210934 RepID=UPI002603A5E8|nr:hypothetical protein [uncultured Legionella sp.]
MAQAILKEWRKEIPGEQFKWVAGLWGESASLAFYLPTHPRALPGFPDRRPALINPHLKWKTEYGVLLCSFSQEQGDSYSECGYQTEQWLNKHNQHVLKRVICYKSHELISYRSKEECITAYWYLASNAAKNMV